MEKRDWLKKNNQIIISNHVKFDVIYSMTL